MRFEQRALRYLWRKKGKSVLLFCLLLIISTMVLCTSFMIDTAQSTSQLLQQKTGTKLVLESKDKTNYISRETIIQIVALEHVYNINRVAWDTVYPVQFALITAQESTAPENQMVTVKAYDDTKTDGFFAEERFRLVEGVAIDKSHPKGILINAALAEKNGLQLGDAISFATASGQTASGNITGIFFSGLERQQPHAILACDRIENQIFVDHRLFQQLSDVQLYASVSVYTAAPEQVEPLLEEVKSIIDNKVSVTTSDALYRQIQAPLEQVIKITSQMLVLTLVTAVLVLSLLLCMWMRTRQREFAVLISLGESRLNLFLQAITEGGIIFLFSVFSAGAIMIPLAQKMMKYLFTAEQYYALQDGQVQVQHFVTLLVLGGLVLLLAVGVAIFPTLQANPRDTLARMEE